MTKGRISYRGQDITKIPDSDFRALHGAAAGTARLIVASAAALLPRVSQPERLQQAAIEIRSGTEIEPQKLADLLVDAGFTREDPVDEHGAFTIRGGIVTVCIFTMRPASFSSGVVK